MAFPSSSITRGITFLRCRIYFMHLALSTVSQNCRIPSTSSALVRGFTSHLIYSFNSCHRFSMGFKSGDSAGVFHQWIAFDSMNSFPWFDVCLGSLSCMNLWLVPYTSLTKGRRVCSRMSVYSHLSIIPSKTHIPVLPCTLIPAHTFTFVGCLALQRESVCVCGGEL